MTKKRFTIENDVEMKDNWHINKRCYHFGNGFDAKDCCNMLNELLEENQRLKSKNSKLHNELFEQRTRNALERTRDILEGTEISRQSYKTPKEFLKDLEKW